MTTAAVSAGLLAVLLLFGGAAVLLPVDVSGPVAEGAWTARSRALFSPSGFHRPEFDAAGERHFSWSSDSSRLEFAGINRSVSYVVALTVETARPAGHPPPVVRVFVDDRLALARTIEGTHDVLRVALARRDSAGASILIETDPVYEPGGGDSRRLGLLVTDVTVSPVDARWRPTAGVALRMFLAVAGVAAGLWWLGLGRLALAFVLAPVVLGFVWLALRDAAFAGDFPDRLLRIGLVGGGLAGLAALVRLRWRDARDRPGWPLAVAVTLVLALVKVALFWHPWVNVGDALFQVHRAQLVHAGEFFFTSVTPRPFFEFPYPVALYVAAQPFWSWFPTELDVARLLRTISIAADALVGLALYAAARRSGWPRAVALAACVFWPFARAPFEALTNANLTNLFGQGVFGAGLAMVAALAAAPARAWAGWIAASALIAIGFLSHFGTLTVGLVMLGSVCVVLSIAGRGWPRRAAGALAAASIAATLVAWVAYYSHPRFVEVYGQTYASVRSGDRDDTSKLVASPGVKLGRWWSGVGDDYGRPGVVVLLAAAAGVWLAFRRRPRDATTFVFAGWLAAWLALSALGILSPLTLRANLAAAPAIIYFAAVLVGTLAGAGRAGQLAAAALAVAIVWDGWSIALRA